MRTRANALLLAFSLLLTLTLRAYSQQTSNLTQVARIDLKGHPDSFRLFSGSDEDHGRRGPLFAVDTTPGGDFVALVAMQSGPWHLIRARDWAAPKPVVEHLNVPGYGAAQSSGEFSIAPQILITKNGEYLVTGATDPWPPGDDATVNVIDLQTFNLVVTQRVSQHGLVGDWQLGPEETLQVHGSTKDEGKPVGSEQWLAFLSLPSLQIVERCDYSVAFNPPNLVPVLKAELHGTPSPMCAREAQNQVAHQNDLGELQQLTAELNPACGIEATTLDHRYAVGTCRDCHQTLFGVSCKSEKSEIYGCGSNKSIATLIHAPHKLTRVVIAPSHGKLYLLSIQDAEKLTVYQVQALP
jgi:hypothetical protein